MNTQRTSTFLMANLGAEVSRIFSAKDNHDEIQMRDCLERAQKILKEIMTIPDMKTRVVEMDTLSDVLTDTTRSNQIFNIQRKNLTSYFTPFMLKVMASR